MSDKQSNHKIDVDKFLDQASKRFDESSKIDQVKKFIQHHKNIKNRRVVLISSGRTSVPLERNTVRFITNFSRGGRGSILAEEFIHFNSHKEKELKEHDYAIIYLHHETAYQPFGMHYFNSIEELLQLNGESLQVQEMKEEKKQQITGILKSKKYVEEGNMMVNVSFDSLDEYLYLLSMCVKEMSCLNEGGLVVCSAAVSDFYIPFEKLSEHKIQSREVKGMSQEVTVEEKESGNTLELVLEQTPKMLGMIKEDWAKQCCCISFKLETDKNIILDKVKKAMINYKVDGVCANMRQNYQDEVNFVTMNEKEELNVKNLKREKGKRLETEIARIMIDIHNRHSSQISNKE